MIFDANPEHWTAPGKIAKDLTQQERGDAYWCRKLASASLSVLTKVLVVTGMAERRLASNAPDPIGDDGDAGSLDKEIRRAEREAAKILKRIQAGSRERQT